MYLTTFADQSASYTLRRFNEIQNTIQLALKIEMRHTQKTTKRGFGMRKRIFKHLTWNDRLKIEKALKQKMTVSEIAHILRVSRNTIYLELKRGEYTHQNHDYTFETRYSPDIAHTRYRQNLKEKGPPLKIGSDHELVKYIENKILNENYSPAAVLGEISAKGLKFKTTVTVRTLYGYIEKGYFHRITNQDLPMRGRKKRKYKRVRTQKRVSKGESIEKRPEYIEERTEYGHWELDLLQGKQNTKPAVMVMTERKSREQLMIKVPDKKAQTIVNAINTLERKYKGTFKDKFKTITVDNGSEFMDFRGIEKSITFGTRTKVYYCHPYSAYERGSNEKQNQIIRRFFPKGTNFTRITQKQIKKVQDWLNSYPRAIFAYQSANDMIPCISIS